MAIDINAHRHRRAGLEKKIMIQDFLRHLHDKKGHMLS